MRVRGQVFFLFSFDFSSFFLTPPTLRTYYDFHRDTLPLNLNPSPPLARLAVWVMVLLPCLGHGHPAFSQNSGQDSRNPFSRSALLDPKVIAILKRTVTLGERISVHRPQEELGRVFEGAL